MSELQLHAKMKGREKSFRNAANTLEGSHQKSQRGLLPAHLNSHTLAVQSADGFGHENDHPTEDTTVHGESLRQIECPRASSSPGEAYSSTNQPASAYLSLQHYSDYVVMVPTPRTSSPIPDRSPTSGKRHTDVSVNLELEQERGNVDDERENRKVVGCHGSKDAARNRGSSQLQKTVGRLKRYFGLAAACGTSSESRQDDSSASREAGCRPPRAEHDEIEAADVDGMTAKRRTHSHSASPDTAVDGRHIPRPDLTGIHRIRHQPEKYPASLRAELKAKHHHDPAASLMGRKSLHGVKVSVDDLALATVVPGVRVRVAPRRQLSHHERPLTESNRIGGIARTGSWLNDAHARSRANVERWLCRNSEADTGRLCSTLSRHQHRRRSVQRASHEYTERSRGLQTSHMSRMERSMSETDVRRPAQIDHFRPRDKHLVTSNSSSVPGTPNAAGSTGAEGESRLGPSLVRLVAEIIEGLEQRSRDDSSAVWSGIRATGTPVSKVFQQLTSRARNAELVASSPATVECRCPEDKAGQKDGAASCRDRSSLQDKTRDDSTEKTLTERRENLDERATTESNEKSSGTVPSCSVAVLRQRLLRAVEGNSSRRAVTERPLHHRKTHGKDSEATTGHFQTSASINCGTGILYVCSIVALYRMERKSPKHLTNKPVWHCWYSSPW